MRIPSNFWLLGFPYLLGVLANLYIQWDLQPFNFGSRQHRFSFSLELKAIAPFLAALFFFSVGHAAWTQALPFLAAVFPEQPYDNGFLVLGRCLTHLFAAVLTYLISDRLCRRLLHPPFLRPGTHEGAKGAAEPSAYVEISMCLPPNEQVGQ